MPRRARKNLTGDFFHVIVQGIAKEYIFEENFLKTTYLKLLLKERKKFDLEILEYCIMGNHAHVLLYCEKNDEMSLYMKNVNTQYALFYNAYKNRVGYVFRDRFLSEPIFDKNHLYKCIPYIHMNPVIAKIVDKPWQYKYSSYNDFINKSGIVTDSVIEKLFGNQNNNYIDFFKFLHLEIGSGKEYKEDIRKLSFFQAEMIINKTMNDYCINNLKDEKVEIQRYFCQKFIDANIAIYHIEKILKIDHRKIKRMNLIDFQKCSFPFGSSLMHIFVFLLFFLYIIYYSILLFIL